VAVRLERTGGEIADWIGVLGALLDLPRDGVLLQGGPGARLAARLCRAKAVTLGRAMLFSSAGWRELDRKSEAGLLLLAHELVHVRQYRELGFFRFLFLYVAEYLGNRRLGHSHREAYLELSFEKEARNGERVARRLLERGALLRGWSEIEPQERS